MRRVPLLAVAAILIGAVIVLVKVTSDGVTPSWMLLLGALFIADGVIRIMLNRVEREPDHPDNGSP